MARKIEHSVLLRWPRFCLHGACTSHCFHTKELKLYTVYRGAANGQSEATTSLQVRGSVFQRKLLTSEKCN